ncbi:hypothetical protein WR25_12836 [Diploscapter pachys]|uniref:Uncharacterized protein n=1 Tax=Diploscapter pachys TaxID=2018661 RepID=A0A2A2JBI4_9BILA|nr:hypothetical protein WR25_12836 [Diploscapter pachys]
MMNFAILLWLFKYSNSCLTTPDMDLPPVQPTTYAGNLHCTLNEFVAFEKLNNNRYRYDGVLIDTYNHVHVHIDVHIGVHIDVHIDAYNHVHVHNNVHNNYI